jgi:hypothetical protein
MTTTDIHIFHKYITEIHIQNLITMYLTKLTKPSLLFKPNKSGIKRFAIYYYSTMYLMPYFYKYNNRLSSTATSAKRETYFRLLINQDKYKYKDVINFLYNKLIDSSNVVKIANETRNTLYRIDIEEEYMNYCLRNNLVNMGSRSISRSRSTSTF